MIENFPQIDVRHQATEPGNWENTKQDHAKTKNERKTTCKYIIIKIAENQK